MVPQARVSRVLGGRGRHTCKGRAHTGAPPTLTENGRGNAGAYNVPLVWSAASVRIVLPRGVRRCDLEVSGSCCKSAARSACRAAAPGS